MKRIDNTIHQTAETLSKSVTADTAQDLLADRLPAGLFAIYLMIAFALAVACGSSFLLADTLRAAGYAAATAGSVVSVGTVSTLIGSLFAGRLAERTGILPLVAVSASIMAAAMACFAMIATGGLPLAYAGGLLLGLGWSIFYMLAPIQLIHCLKSSARLEALTLLAGAQMLGIGVSTPLGHAIADHFGGPGNAYAFYAVFCTLAAAFSLLIRRRMTDQPQLPMRAVALSVAATLSILRAKTVVPVIMMGIAACTFAGLSTFQSFYAGSRGLTPDIFFLTFTVTTVALRFSVASMIGKLPLGHLALTLFVATFLGIGLLVINTGNTILYVSATVLFATGYGLTYSTLNAMVVNLAGERGLSIPVASQVFTLGYFVGSFGFPYFAGSLIADDGIDAALLVMVGLVAANIAIAGWMLLKATTDTGPVSHKS